MRTLLAIKTTLRSPRPLNAPHSRKVSPPKRTNGSKNGCRRQCPKVETWEDLIGASWLRAGLLLYPQNRILCRLGDSEFDDGLGWNLDLLLRLGIEAEASLPLLLYELAKSGQDEFSILFDRFVGEVAERIEEYASRCFVGFSGSSECDLKFSFGYV